MSIIFFYFLNWKIILLNYIIIIYFNKKAKIN